MRTLVLAALLLVLAGCSADITEPLVADARCARRPSRALIETVAPPGLVDVTPPHKPEEPVR